MFSKLHAKLGDLWWYSAMIFIACRLGDVIQAFIGLWLVPRYVGTDELGAILPLQQLCGLFAAPIAILATVFSKFVNTYATREEYGKVKSFIHDVLAAASVIFLFCIIAAYLVIPHFYERLRVMSGSLTILILAAGFSGNISQLFSNALQGLKRFKTMTALNFVSAPIRLVTLLAAMPFRALSGYILGQTTPSASTTLIAGFAIRRQLRGIKRDTSWRCDIPAILRYLWPIAIYTAFGALFAAVIMTIYRQRLPEAESAAYYLISRFAETASYVGISMTVILFPLAAEAHEKGNENPTILKHTLMATFATTLAIALGFALVGKYLFSLTDTWASYLPYVHLLPWITVIFGISSMIGAIISYEMACRRFSIAYFITGFNAFIVAILISFTGYDFFRGILPDDIVDWLALHNLTSLVRLTCFNVTSSLIQLCALIIYLIMKNHSSKRIVEK
jgi:O-antigen/teichoic acid export membrane protein